MKFRLALLDHPKAAMALWLALLVLGTSVGAALYVRDVGWPGAADETTSSAAAAQTSGSQASLADLGEDVLTDSDADGLADTFENFAYGSDPHEWSTGGHGVPDGWLARFGYDPTEPGVERRAAAVPPADRLPDAYGGEWPPHLRWTLADAYAADRPPTWDEEAQGPWDNGIDPREWAPNDEAIPYAWLNHYDLPLLDPDIDGTRLGDDTFTVRENFEANTDPRTADTDEDGLTDAEELRIYSTDPRNPSTSGTGILDGWLVRYDLDPADRSVGTQDPGNKGLTVLETFEYNAERFGAEEAIAGKGLDPRSTSTQGLPIPDGWLVQYDLDPLDPDVVEAVVGRASDFDDLRDLESAPGANPPLSDVVLTVLDAYRYKRPTTWSEEDQGPWLGGLDPTRPDPDGDGLPTVVEIRGWYVERWNGLGSTAQQEFFVARSDPRIADTDGDGLTDGEEYAGTAERDDVVYRWTPSDPANPDTAFSGLTDADKVLGLPGPDGKRNPLTKTTDGEQTPFLDPSRMDTDGDFLADGAELETWLEAAEAADAPYKELFPASDHATFDDWIAEMPGAQTSGSGGTDKRSLLGPLGDLDDDGLPNVVDPDADEDGLLDGWEVDPPLLAFSEFPVDGPRAPTDPANPDTDGDDLLDAWELRYGEWDPADRAWDLDPSRYSSAGDGQSDGKANLDGDVVEWFAYTGPESSRTAEPRTFSFINLFEQARGTNPRLADENGDGVTEGWVFFWGSQYPNQVREAAKGDENAREEVGLIVPTEEELAALTDVFTDPLADVGGTGKDSFEAVRFFEVPGDPSTAQQLLRPGETLAIDPPNEIDVLRDGFRVTAVIAEARSEPTHSLADDQANRLNPYLLDTDGDGAPDAWEAHVGRCGAGAVDAAVPSVPDGHGDPDGDELSNIEEWEQGTRPCEADTDLGGVADGVEAGVAALSPLDPGDDATPQGDNVADDGDQVPLDQELLQGTDPANPDTDRDGLLDGDDVSFLISALDEETRPIFDALIARGIAHELEPDAPGGPTMRFFGEKTNKGAARNPDTSGDGIPDGWLAYHAGRADVRRDSFLASYECGRPDWWDEARLGVWWWGVRPVSGGPCTDDMDFDGLSDSNGEDPMPAASHQNVLATDLPVLPDTLGLAADPLTLWLAGQSYGECAGDPTPCQDEWPTASHGGDRPDVSNRAPIDFESASASLPDRPGLGPVIPKEEDFSVTGRLVIESSSTGVPRRTVVAELVGPSGESRPIGVGFTADDGTFSFDACLCVAGEAHIPQDGMVAFARQVQGPVEWTSGADEVPVGQDLTVRVRAYATTATFYSGDPADETHPLHVTVTYGGETYHATDSAAEDVTTATVTSETVLGLSGPTNLKHSDAGRNLAVTVRLVDASGAAVDNQVVGVEAVGLGLAQPTTDVAGAATATFTVPVGRTTPIDVTAHYDGDPSLGYDAAPDPDPLQVTLQAPLTISAAAPSDPVRIGSPYETQATVRSANQPVPDILVRASLGSVVATGVTDTDGRAEFTLSTSGLDGTVDEIRFQVDESDAYAAATLALPVELVSAVELQAALPATVGTGSPLLIEGRLTTLSGQPLAGRAIQMSLGDIALGVTHTGEDGRFEASFDVEGLHVPAGAAFLLVHYEGEPGAFEPETLSRNVQVVVNTALSLADRRAGQGQEVTIRGTLREASGRPLPGHYVDLTLDGEPIGRAISLAGGRFHLLHTLAGNITTGPHTIRAEYTGSSNGTYAESTVTAELRIGAPTNLTILAPETLARGNNTLTVVLQAADGTAVPSADIHLHSTLDPSITVEADDGTKLTISRGSVVTTGGEGRATATFNVDSERPGQDIWFEASYMGNEDLAPSSENVSVPLRVPANLSATIPPEAGRGVPLRIRAHLTEDRGTVIENRSLTASMAGGRAENLSAAAPVDLIVHVPLDVPLGLHEVTVSFAGDAYHFPATLTREVLVKDGANISIQAPEEVLQPGQPFEVNLRLTDAQGSPLVGRVVGVRLEGDTVATAARTDAEGNASVVLTAPADGESRVLAFFGGDEAIASQSSASPVLQVAAPSSSAEAPSWRVAAFVGAALIVLGVLGLLVWRGLRKPYVPQTVLGEAADRIAAGDPWTAAVLIAYRRLASYLARHGFKERPAETVREFVQDLARVVRLPDESAVGLVQLFEAARYGHGKLGPEHARWARQNLQRITRSIGQEARRVRP